MRVFFGFLLLPMFLFSFQQALMVQDSLATQTQPQVLEEVVVTDSRFPFKQSQSGKRIKKITQTTLRNFQGMDLSELLSSLAGIEMIGEGSYPGQNKTLSLRGGRNRQVLILIDGVRVSDPSRIDNDFNLNFLPLANIASIEIMKGASSTLYGSAAATGVINISTNPLQNGFHTSIQSSVGSLGAHNQNRNSLDRFQNAIAIQNGTEKWGLSLQAAHLYADGMSAVIGSEQDPFLRYQWEAKIKHQPNSQFNWGFTFGHHNIESAYDNSFPLADAAFELFTKMNRIQLNSDYSYGKGRFSLRSGYQKTRRNFKSDYPYETLSENSTFDLFHTRNFKDKFYTVMGLQWQQNYAAFDAFPTSQQTDFYANVVSQFSTAFRINSGLRWNRHSTYNNHFTYSFNPSLLVVQKNELQLKFMGAASSAFIAPSLYQLFDPYAGNIDLTPEENQSFEVGLSLDAPKFSGGLLYFGRLENAALVYDMLTYRYANGPDNLWYEGIEFDFDAALSDTIRFEFQYLFTTTATGDLRYLPKHATLSQLQYQFNSNTFFHLNWQTKGKRLGLDNKTLLDGYQLLDFHIQKQLPTWKVDTSLRVTNVFNVNYVQLEGYATRGRNFMLVLRYAPF
ncbi:MAG: TonB-dependent receptor plug domain-containing protein [Flavobacteriaceae bacterium]